MKLVTLAVVLAFVASAPVFAAGSDGFAYPDGNLWGNGDWVRGDNTGQIVVNTQQVEIVGGDGARSTGNIVIAQGMVGTVYIDFDVVADGVGGSTLWGFCVDDSTQAGFAGGNMARWYGTSSSARGRIDGLGAGYVTPEQVLTAGQHHLTMILTTTTGGVDFYVDGGLLGTIANLAPGAAVGRVSFERISNAGAAGQSFFIDNLRIANTAIPEPASLVALMTGLVGVAGFARRRR